MSAATNGITIFLDVSGATVGAVDNVIQTLNSGSTVETAAGTMQVVAALTGPIVGLGLLTNTVALTMTAVTADQGQNGASPGQIISAIGNVVAMAAGAFAIAGVAVPALTVAGVVLTIGGAAYNFYDMYQKLKPTESSIDSQTNTLYLNAQNWQPPRDPLVLDLDGDGIETVGITGNTPVLFDHDADGIRTGTGWIGADDGLLVLDLNGNGVIDSGRELFGDNTRLPSANGTTPTAANGYAALAQHDSNADGQINSQDAIYSQLRVWRDLNQDGISQTGEMQTLAQTGIASIGVQGTFETTDLGQGNSQIASGSFTRTDGTSGTLGVAELSGSLLVVNKQLMGCMATQSRKNMKKKTFPARQGTIVCYCLDSKFKSSTKSTTNEAC